MKNGFLRARQVFFMGTTTDPGGCNGTSLKLGDLYGRPNRGVKTPESGTAAFGYWVEWSLCGAREAPRAPQRSG